MQSFRDYLFNLQATSSSEAKRLWKKSIKDSWNHQCAYCKSSENLTLDHVIPNIKGGTDTTNNMVCCCKTCNQSKAHTNWEEWYKSQLFFNEENYQKIKEWIEPEKPVLYSYSKKNYLK